MCTGIICFFRKIPTIHTPCVPPPPPLPRPPPPPPSRAASTRSRFGSKAPSPPSRLRAPPPLSTLETALSAADERLMQPCETRWRRLITAATCALPQSRPFAYRAIVVVERSIESSTILAHRKQKLAAASARAILIDAAQCRRLLLVAHAIHQHDVATRAKLKIGRRVGELEGVVVTRGPSHALTSSRTFHVVASHSEDSGSRSDWPRCSSSDWTVGDERMAVNFEAFSLLLLAARASLRAPTAASSAGSGSRVSNSVAAAIISASLFAGAA